MKSIKGTSKYIELESGFWGIVDESGNKYLPINMPEQLKSKGAPISCKIRLREDVESIHMWGTPVEIISFNT